MVAGRGGGGKLGARLLGRPRLRRCRLPVAPRRALGSFLSGWLLRLSVFDYDFRTPLMRILIARLVLASALIGSCLVGCANRGMVAPSEETGSGGGSGGTVALGGSGGSAPGGKGGGTGGSGTGGSATGGKGGGTGGSNVDASCSVVTDALFDHSAASCNATYSFERTTEGATLLAGSQAFTGVSQGVTPNVYCGAGSL